jgi:hypothetical protein
VWGSGNVSVAGLMMSRGGSCGRGGDRFLAGPRDGVDRVSG